MTAQPLQLWRAGRPPVGAPSPMPMEHGVLRLSNYAIFAELNAEEVLLLHGYSGAWDIVSASLARELKQWRRGPRFEPLIGRPFTDDNDECSSGDELTIPDHLRERLITRGYLTTLTPAAERLFVGALASELHAMAANAPPSYVFTVSYECNLTCSYCFQHALRSRPENAPLLVAMSPVMVDRIFAAMPEIDALHGWNGTRPRPERKITLFGGEPLLGRFRPLVQYIVERARRDGPASVSAVSNGTELHHYGDLIGPDGISFIQITVDGDADSHDRRRIGSDGAPTFHRIANNIDLAIARGAQVKLRVNVDRTTWPRLASLAELIETRGWFAAENFSAYATPVHESSGGEHEACGFGSWGLGQRLEELAVAHPLVRSIHGPDEPWQRRVRQLLEGARDPLLSLQPSYCGAHTQTWVFDAHGDIYACWERAGYPKDRIGRIAEDGQLHMDAATEHTWRSRTVASNPVCGSCPYAFYCGGGCALLAELKNGTLHSNFCDDFSRRFKALAASVVTAGRLEPFVHAAQAWQHAHTETGGMHG